jgi:thiamine kinase-like enzyme
MSIDLECLKGIPERLLPRKITSVREIKGGLNNRNILLNNSYLLKEFQRRDEENDPLRERYEREKQALHVLKTRNFMPELVKWEEKDTKYYLVRKWVEGDILTFEKLQSHPEELIKILSELHKEKYTFKFDFDYFDVIERYIKEYSRYEWNPDKMLPKVENIIYAYTTERNTLFSQNHRSSLNRIHGDLVFSNIIVSPSAKNYFFIDWEYTTYGDSLIDLAYFFTQNSIPEHTRDKLISLYEQYCDIKVDRSQLGSYCTLMRLMSGLWYALQALRLEFTGFLQLQTDISSSDFINLALQTFSIIDFPL